MSNTQALAELAPLIALFDRLKPAFDAVREGAALEAAAVEAQQAVEAGTDHLRKVAREIENAKVELEAVRVAQASIAETKARLEGEVAALDVKRRELEREHDIIRVQRESEQAVEEQAFVDRMAAKKQALEDEIKGLESRLSTLHGEFDKLAEAAQRR